MVVNLNIKVDSPADQAVIGMISHLIKLTKSDFYKTYQHWKWCYEHTRGKAAEQRAKEALDNASGFFYGDLFCTVSPVVGDEYVDYLIREIEEGHIDQFNPPEEPN